MAKTLLNPWLIAAGLLFAGHQFLQKAFGFSLPAADSYLDPFLLAPLLLSAMLLERRWLFGKGPAYRLSLPELVLSALVLAFISEWLFPRLSPRFTSDSADVAAIFAGTLFFHLTVNRSDAGPSENSE